VTALTDDALRALLRSDPAAGWRAFIDEHTPLLIGLIRRAGLVDRDEVMEIYVVMCEQLSARNFDRLKSQDAARGSIGGWLAVVARHTIVDWVRSRKGRRRLFHAVEALPRFDQRVFELYYWEERTPSEIVEFVAQETRERTDLSAVLGALDRIQATLSDRHRAELLAMAVRAKAPIPIDDTDVAEHMPGRHGDPESDLRIADVNARLESALARLPAEDAAIVRLKYIEGLTTADVELAVGVAGLTARRLQEILTRLRASLKDLGVDAADAGLGRQYDRSAT
jgi:DNA-directed RNA polymerase specialized sigma24 family protein